MKSLIGLLAVLLIGTACSTPTPVVIVVTATPVASETAVAIRLIATFTPTSERTSTPIPPSDTPTPKETAMPDFTATPSPAPTASFIAWDEAATHVGEEITLCGPVMDAHYATTSNGKPTFLNLGETYPNLARFTIVIWGQDRENFPGKPEELYTDQEICVTGTIEEYDGALEMVVSEPGQIIVP